MKKLANKISLLVIILTLQACGSGGTDQKDKNSEQNSATLSLSNEQVKNAGVVVNKGEVKKISSIIKVNGKIEVPPQNMVSVSVMLGGYLKSTHLLPGTKIKQGEVIAIFEDQQYIQIQQDYLTSQEKMNYARKEYERQKDLNQSKASSDKVLQLAETEFKTQQITVRSLYEKLKLIGIRPESLNESNISRSINLYSPIDGFVSKVNVNIGKYVNPSDVIFELINPTDIHLALNVFEKDVSKLFVGQKVKAFSNNSPDKKLDAEVILISQDLTKDNNVIVHCHFKSFEKELLPRMYMNAEIEVLSNNAFTVPEESVVNYEGKNYIFIAEDANSFQMTEVKVGITEGGYTELMEAESLKTQDIATKGAYNLLMGLKNKSD